jgi:hypothetical protein
MGSRTETKRRHELRSQQEIAEMTRLSVPALKALLKSRQFPEPAVVIRGGDGIREHRRWTVAQVEQWLEKRVRQTVAEVEP